MKKKENTGVLTQTWNMSTRRTAAADDKNIVKKNLKSSFSTNMGRVKVSQSTTGQQKYRDLTTRCRSRKIQKNRLQFLQRQKKSRDETQKLGI